MAARLEAGDVTEDTAAARIARAVAGAGLTVADAFTGRANLYASASGIALIDRARIIALNAIDEALTVATLPPFARVDQGQMVATVKIITFAVPEAIVAGGEALAQAKARDGAEGGSLVAVAPFKAMTPALIVTTLPGSKPSVIAKRQSAVRDRLSALAGPVADTHGAVVVAHEIAAVAEAIAAAARGGAAPILVFGASAIVDRGDVIPAALEQAGGRITHLGMPVDPGNLLMLGDLHGTPVVGVPSCASSPKINGFDWVLERLAAGLPVGRDEIVEMSVGGLLMEIPSRPQPRQG